MPKCVVHTQNRWMYFHQLAAAAGDMTSDDVFLSAIPAPFGFGIWTAHVTPAVLGAPTVVHERFDADAVIAAIERERVTVLACVSTQFLMMLKSPAIERHDLSSLRCMFTGGEAVPYERAARFEDVTGARVLQFYGSNETGALSHTSMRDDRDHRLQTAGRRDRRHARAAARRRGARHHDARHARASRLQGTGDLPRLPRRRARPTTSCSPPTAGCASATCAPSTPTGTCGWSGARPTSSSGAARTSALPAVEAEVAEHPAVAVAAAVAMPDEVFGERVCLYAELEPGATLDLDGLVGFLRDQGVSPEWFPERLIVLDALPRASGGKVAKGELRADILRRAAREQDPDGNYRAGGETPSCGLWACLRSRSPSPHAEAATPSRRRSSDRRRRPWPATTTTTVPRRPPRPSPTTSRTSPR